LLDFGRIFPRKILKALDLKIKILISKNLIRLSGSAATTTASYFEGFDQWSARSDVTRFGGWAVDICAGESGGAKLGNIPSVRFPSAGIRQPCSYCPSIHFPVCRVPTEKIEIEADDATAVPLLLALLHINETVAGTCLLVNLTAPVDVTFPC
jgi:hypothetical protein